MSKDLQEIYDQLPEYLKEEIEKVSKKYRLSEKEKKRLIEKTFEEFIRSRFEPGEAIGILTAQSISEPATQMCLDYKERIIVKVNNIIGSVRIGEFVDKLINKFGSIKKGCIEIVDLPKDIKIYALGLNENEKVEWKRIRSCIRMKNSENLVEVTTKSGRKVKASKSHTFVIKRDDKLVNIKGSELRVGMKIPVVKYLPHNSLHTLQLEEIKKVVRLDKLFGFFLGVFALKGYVDLNHGTVCISSLDNNSAKNVKLFLDKIGLKYEECFYEKNGKKNENLVIHSKALSNFLSKKFGESLEKRKIPEFVLSANKEFVSSFLKAILNNHSNENEERKIISSKSEDFIDGIKLLLARFGIFSKKFKHKKKYSLSISYEYSNSSHIVWDEIIKIKEVKPFTEYIYDINVEDLHTFSTFDGVIVHNTMRTYHVAGSVGLKITLGLPRLIEIFDARRELETPSMSIYLKPKYNIETQAIKFAKKIRETKIEDVAEISINLSENAIELKCKNERTADKIKEIIESRIKGVKCRKRRDTILAIPKKELSIKELRTLRGKISSLTYSGVKGIENAIVIREGNNWIIQTFGSNLEEILKFPEVDKTKTCSNNPHEVAKVLGIEAARNLIIKEAYKTMQEQGLDVDIRFLKIVADIMTFSGEVQPIGRYGVAGKKASVLARASFEETVKHLVNAAVRGSVDNLRGLFENLMIGNLVPAGTGKVEIIMKIGEESE